MSAIWTVGGLDTGYFANYDAALGIVSISTYEGVAPINNIASGSSYVAQASGGAYVTIKVTSPPLQSGVSNGAKIYTATALATGPAPVGFAPKTLSTDILTAVKNWIANGTTATGTTGGGLITANGLSIPFGNAGSKLIIPWLWIIAGGGVLTFLLLRHHGGDNG